MKKSLFLFCFLPLSSLAFFGNNFNNKKFNLDNTSYKIQNNFDTSLDTNTTGSFHSYSVTTGWKVLVYDSTLKSNISKFKNFYLNDEISFMAEYIIGLYIFNTQFETSNYLINNKVTTKEFYFDGNDAAGYYQAKVTFYFKLVNNTVFFKVDNYVYAGWCFFNVWHLYSDTKLNQSGFLTFF